MRKKTLTQKGILLEMTEDMFVRVRLSKPEDMSVNEWIRRAIELALINQSDN